MKIHIVKAGETLYTLAKKYGLDLAKLLAANPDIADPDNVAVGQKVKIPLPPKPSVQPVGPVQHVHKVVQGDTLWKLAKQWNVPLADMIKANPHLKNPNVLMTGETVFIPAVPSGEPGTNAGEPGGTGMKAGESMSAAGDGPIGQPQEQQVPSPVLSETCPQDGAGEKPVVPTPEAEGAMPGSWPWHDAVSPGPWQGPWPPQFGPLAWPWPSAYGGGGLWNDWSDDGSWGDWWSYASWPWTSAWVAVGQTGCGCGGGPTAVFGFTGATSAEYATTWPSLYDTGTSESRDGRRSAETETATDKGRAGDPDGRSGVARLAVIDDGPKKKKPSSPKPRRDRFLESGPAQSRPWINL